MGSRWQPSGVWLGCVVLGAGASGDAVEEDVAGGSDTADGAGRTVSDGSFPGVDRTVTVGDGAPAVPPQAASSTAPSARRQTPMHVASVR